MKKFLLVAAIVAVILITVKFLKEWHQGVEADLYGKKEEKSAVAERHGIVGPDLGEASKEKVPEAAAPSIKTPPVNTPAVTPTAQPNVVVCNQDMEAFNPARPSVVIGKFLKGSTLTIGSKDTVSGMFYVVYKQADGRTIRALCRAEDLGR